jgi:hypothetical protein
VVEQSSRRLRWRAEAPRISPSRFHGRQNMGIHQATMPYRHAHATLSWDHQIQNERRTTRGVLRTQYRAAKSQTASGVENQRGGRAEAVAFRASDHFSTAPFSQLRPHQLPNFKRCGIFGFPPPFGVGSCRCPSLQSTLVSRVSTNGSAVTSWNHVTGHFVHGFALLCLRDGT